MAEIVILDAKTVSNGDVSFDPITKLAKSEIYDFTQNEEIIKKSLNSKIIITNKVPLNAETLAKLPKLELITVLATGYDKIDVAACKELNIKLANVADYSTYSVVQTVFAHLFNITQKIAIHDQFVHDGKWCNSKNFSGFQGKLTELYGKKFGIIGFGNIGRKVAEMAELLGMELLINTQNPQKYHNYPYNFVKLDELLKESDVISLHLPANITNNNMINNQTLKLMKNSVILINTARGTLIKEDDLANALNNDEISYALLDVFAKEPADLNNPLLKAKNCQITPHIAWASYEARKRIIDEVALNIKAFYANIDRNRIC